MLTRRSLFAAALSVLALRPLGVFAVDAAPSIGWIDVQVTGYHSYRVSRHRLYEFDATVDWGKSENP